MGYYLLILLLIGTVLYSFKRPDIGVFAYFLMSIMAPQFIWPWVFDAIPAFSIVAGTTILAFVFSMLFGKVDLSVYKHHQNILLLIMVLFFNLSTTFSPFPEFSSFTSALVVQETLNTIVIMYFVCLPLIAKEDSLKNLIILFTGIIIYYVYWSNSAYFSYEFFRFNQGRLPGPQHSPYRDENVFGVLFIVGMPFLLFGFFYFKNIFIKALLGLSLLFLWHSIILTGSRGALVAVSCATIFAYGLIKSRMFGAILIVGFIAAIIYQGGQLLDRTQNTITVAQEDSEKKLDPRLQSWEVGLGLIKRYPLFGVGVQRFQQATRMHYPDRIAYVAHNTFLNFAANTGLINGVIYIYFFFLHFKFFRFARKNNIENYPFLNFANKAIMTGLVGFYVGAMFLDLIIFEAYYFLLLLGLAKDRIFKEIIAQEHTKAQELTKQQSEIAYA